MQPSTAPRARTRRVGRERGPRPGLPPAAPQSPRHGALGPAERKRRADLVKQLNDNLSQLPSELNAGGNLSELQEPALKTAIELVRLGRERLKVNQDDTEAVQNVLDGEKQINALLASGLPSAQQAATARSTLFVKPPKPRELLDVSKDEKDVDMFKYGEMLGNALTAGMEAAFAKGTSVRKVFAALGKSIMQQLGELFTQMGQAYLSFGAIMNALYPLLGDPASAGPAGLAIGAALIALGATLGAIVSSGGAGGAPSFAGITVGGEQANQYLTPNPNAPYAAGTQYPGIVQPVFNVIGPADGSAQRAIAQLLQNAGRRGYSAPAFTG